VLRRETDSDEIQLFNNEILNAPEEEVAPQVIDEAILACKELGFKESEVFKLAQKIIKEHPITKPEQLVHLVLKEM